MNISINFNEDHISHTPETGVGVVEGVLALAVQLGLAPGELPCVPLTAGPVHPLPALAAVLHQEPPLAAWPLQDGHSVMVGISLDTWDASSSKL